jgi:hypothetical protein
VREKFFKKEGETTKLNSKQAKGKKNKTKKSEQNRLDVLLGLDAWSIQK